MSHSLFPDRPSQLMHNTETKSLEIICISLLFCHTELRNNLDFFILIDFMLNFRYQHKRIGVQFR